MKQFHHFKEKYPDCILFFRMGDFYETFYEDAQVCSQVCGLTLTSRSKGTNPIPLAGVPFHAVDGYLKKMIQAGYKVAVCEQVEDAKLAKGVVKRDVVRVVTPGTLTDDMLLDAKRDNFLCAVSMGADSAAISWVDISTGHFFARTVPERDVVDEILRIGPAECVLPDARGELFEGDIKKLSREISTQSRAVVTLRPSWYFEPVAARKKLLSHFGTKNLEGFGINDGDEIISPAGAVIEYLGETQKTALGHIAGLKKVEHKRFLQIDPVSLRSLEVLRTIRGESSKGTLIDSFDQTLTGMGGRMIRNWICMPLLDLGQIELRQDVVGELAVDSKKLGEIRGLLKGTADIERIAARVATFRAGPRDLLSLTQSLRKAVPLKEFLCCCEADMLKGLGRDCDTMDDLAELLERAIDSDCASHLREGGVINPGFDAELDELRRIAKDGRRWLSEYQQTQSQRTGIANLKIGFNKVFGYYIEVSHAAAGAVPGDYVRKQTIKNAERYITDELKGYEEKVLTARDKTIEIEQRLFEQIRSRCSEYIARLQKLADVIARCDCLSTFAYIAQRRRFIRPEMTGGAELFIRQGRHPVLAEMLEAEFVANDIELGDDSGDVMIITGPNMSGKSTYIRQTALLVLLAQTGSFIPAAEAKIGLVDRVFTRVGAADELARGQSTFMVEMTETANIINNATEKSLVILDEVGRGTSTYDGLSLAWAITEHIANNIKARTLFATHYHELTSLAELLVNVKNCNVAVREWMDEVVFLHKILPGGTDKSYGIHVAKLAGLPRVILDRSSEILAELESTFEKEAQGEKLTRQRTRSETVDPLFNQAHKSVIERLRGIDVNSLTPIEAINLLAEVKEQMNE